MTEALSRWILGVAAVSLLLSAAETLVVQEGQRRVLRLAGGLVLLAALLGPVSGLLAWAPELPAGYGGELAALREEYAARQEAELSAVIAEETAAYISDKARELGLSCEAEVELRTGEDGVALPWSVRLNVPYHEELSGWLSDRLEIPAQRQQWQEG